VILARSGGRIRRSFDYEIVVTNSSVRDLHEARLRERNGDAAIVAALSTGAERRPVAPVGPAGP
jgi:hypothetical protein